MPSRETNAARASPPGGVNVSRATYTRGEWDPGMELFATTLATTPPQTMVFSVESPPNSFLMVAGGVDPSGIWQSFAGLMPGDFLPQTVTVTNNTDPDDLSSSGAPCIPDFDCESSVRQLAVDTVTISESYYNKQDLTLEIVASTSDDMSICDDPEAPILTAFAEDGTSLGGLIPLTPSMEQGPGYQ